LEFVLSGILLDPLCYLLHFLLFDVSLVFTCLSILRFIVDILSPSLNTM
jgi:hypothetical protein